MRFVIQIEPVAKGRPRFSMRTKRMHTPPSTTAFEKEFRSMVEQVLGGAAFPLYSVDVPLIVDLDFVRRRPEDFDKKAKTRRDKRRLWNPRVYDIDNLQKSVFDALNGVMWEDDKQIVAVRARKFFADPGTPARICVHVRRAGMEPAHLCDTWGDDVDLDWDYTEHDGGEYSDAPQTDDRQITVFDMIDGG